MHWHEREEREEGEGKNDAHLNYQRPMQLFAQFQGILCCNCCFAIGLLNTFLHKPFPSINKRAPELIHLNNLDMQNKVGQRMA